MAAYEFEDEATGELVVLHLQMGTAHKIGETREVDGRRLTRLPSMPLASVARNISVVSETLPLHWPYAPRHDSEGRCVFTSRREIKESVAKSGHTQHDGVRWEG